MQSPQITSSAGTLKLLSPVQTARLTGSANSSAWINSSKLTQCKQPRWQALLESHYANISAGSLNWTKLTHTSRLIHFTGLTLRKHFSWYTLLRTLLPANRSACKSYLTHPQLGWYAVLVSHYHKQHDSLMVVNFP
jgi:hypothetical protein